MAKKCKIIYWDKHFRVYGVVATLSAKFQTRILSSYTGMTDDLFVQQLRDVDKGLKCKDAGLSETKICGRAEAFARAEYRKSRFFDHGIFSRLRIGAGADGGGDICVDLCSGNITYDYAINYYAYVNMGFKKFNRTYNVGGNRSDSGSLGTISSLAILRPYCGKTPDKDSCCCKER